MFQNKPKGERRATEGEKIMELIKIPRLSYLDVEFQVFSDVSRFAELSEMLYKRRGNGNNAAPTLVLKELSYLHQRPIKELQTLFFAVRDAAFAYKRPEDTTHTSKLSPIFPEESLCQWRRWKSHLKKSIKAHRQPLLEVKEFQEKCWKSRDKVKKYANMLEAARSSLPSYKDNDYEYNARCTAIKYLSSDLKSHQKKHVRHLNQYQTMLMREHAARQQIIQLADSLETEVKACLLKQLTDGLNFLVAASTLTQADLSLDLNKVCDNLYAVTCKNYFYSLPPTDVSSPEFNTPLIMPRIEDSNYSFGDFDSTYASHNYVGTVQEDVEKAFDYHLSLKVGDAVKLKMVSRDQRLGFGWTRPSKLSLKKWGFFPVMSIKLYSGQTNDN